MRRLCKHPYNVLLLHNVLLLQKHDEHEGIFRSSLLVIPRFWRKLRSVRYSIFAPTVRSILFFSTRQCFHYPYLSGTIALHARSEQIVPLLLYGSDSLYTGPAEDGRWPWYRAKILDSPEILVFSLPPILLYIICSELGSSWSSNLVYCITKKDFGATLNTQPWKSYFIMSSAVSYTLSISLRLETVWSLSFNLL